MLCDSLLVAEEHMYLAAHNKNVAEKNAEKEQKGGPTTSASPGADAEAEPEEEVIMEEGEEEEPVEEDKNVD